MKEFSILTLVLLLVAGFPAIVRADASHCLECHPSRLSTHEHDTAPSLSGQHPAYIIKQLERFTATGGNQSGPRKDLIMSPASHGLPHDQWEEVANELSARECVYSGFTDVVTYRPNPCASCHGARGISENPEIPNLAGQNRRYLFFAYLKFREQYVPDFPRGRLLEGEVRRNPDMGPIAAHLTDDVTTILGYYAKLPCR